MNFLDLKRKISPLSGLLYESAGGGPGSGDSGSSGDSSSNGRSSTGGTGGGNSGGNSHGGWTGNRSERDARSAGNMAAGNQDGGPAGNKDVGPYGRGMATPTTSYADLQTMQEAGLGLQEGMNPENPTQSVDEMLASERLHRAMPGLIGLAASAVPGASLALGAIKAAQQNTYGSFLGSLVGSATGMPMGAQIGSMVGKAAQTGVAPNASDVGSMVGGYALGTIGAKLGRAALGDDGAAGYVGSLAGGLVGSKVGSSLGAQVGSGVSSNSSASNSSTPGASYGSTEQGGPSYADTYQGGGWSSGVTPSGLTVPGTKKTTPQSAAPVVKSIPYTNMRFNLNDLAAGAALKKGVADKYIPNGG